MLFDTEVLPMMLAVLPVEPVLEPMTILLVEPLTTVIPVNALAPVPFRVMPCTVFP